MGKMINKMYEWFEWRCQVSEEAMAMTMAKLNKLGICYSSRMVQQKRKLEKLLGRYTLLHFLTILENEVDSKCMRIAKFLQVNQEQAVWFIPVQC